MRRWTALLWVCGLVGLALALGGCEKSSSTDESAATTGAEVPSGSPAMPEASPGATTETPAGEATEGTPAAGEESAEATPEGEGEAAKGEADGAKGEAEGTAATPAEGEGEGNAEAPETTEAATPAPPKLEGKLLNVKDDVRILCPDGWKEQDADDGSLLRLVRTKPVGNVQVNFSLDYTVDKSLPANLTVDAFRQEFVNRLPQLFAEKQFTLVDSSATTVAGRGAVSAVGDLTTDTGTFRSKMVVVLQGGAVWTLSVIGPKNEFADVVEPEFDAMAASFELP